MFECVQCGNCCKTFDIVPTDEDVRRWRTEGHNDIIEWVYDAGDDLVHDYIFLRDLETGFCPFLSFNGTVYECKIHETKPEMCKNWPLNKGDKDTIKACMESIGCLGKFKELAEEQGDILEAEG